MKKFGMKIIGFIASATLLFSAAAIGAAAEREEPVEDDTWSATGVATSGAPSGTGSTDRCYMVYSTKGVDVYCNSVTNSKDGGTGYVRVRCANTDISMTPVTLFNAGDSDTCDFVVQSLVRGVDLRFTAYASKGNIYNARGTAHSKR